MDLRIVAAVVAAGILVLTGAVVAWEGTRPSPGPTKGSSTSTGPNGFALSTPTEATQGNVDWYNFTVQGSVASMLASNLAFQVTSANGSTVALGPGATVTLLGPDGSRLGVYDVAKANWTSGAQSPITVEDVFSLAVGASTPLAAQGDSFDALGVDQFSGEVVVAIP